MSITFTNRQEATEYSDKKRREGFKTRIEKLSNKFIVSLTGEKEVFHLTPIDLGEETVLKPHSYYGEYGLGGKAGEKPKVCFAPSPEKCIAAMPDIEMEDIKDVEGTEYSLGTYHVYSPEEEVELIEQHDEEDFGDTEEVASYKPVKARRIGTLQSTSGKYQTSYKWKD